MKLRLRVKYGDNQWSDFDNFTIDQVKKKNPFMIIKLMKAERIRKRNLRNEEVMRKRIEQQLTQQEISDD